MFNLSYVSDASTRNVREARELVESQWYQILWPHIKLADDQNSKVNFSVEGGGFYISQGTGRKVTGGHPDDIIWDDPLAAADCNDAVKKREFSHVYRGAITSRRLARNAGLILVGQRLGVDDPSSVVLEENERAAMIGEPEPWVWVRLPMRYDPDIAMVDRGWGKDWRTERDELIDPNRFTIETVKESELSLGEHASAQLQQDPKDSVGTTFDMDFYQEIDAGEVPELDAVVRFWDTAGTPDGGCQTAGVKMGRKDRKDRYGEQVADYYLLHVHAGQWDIDSVDDEIETTSGLDLIQHGFDLLTVAMEIGFGGKHAVRSIEKLLKGIKFEAVPTGGKNKRERAKPLAREQRRGRFFVVRGPWTPGFKAQLSRFPNGDLIDQVDAAAGAHLVLEGTLGKPRKPKKAIMSGLGKRSMCIVPGCDRPAAKDSQYCCASCEQVAAFNDPTMRCKDSEHSDECKLRYFESRQ